MSTGGVTGALTGLAGVAYCAYVWKRSGVIAARRTAERERREAEQQSEVEAAVNGPLVDGVVCPACHRKACRRFQPVERRTTARRDWCQFVCTKCGYRL